MNIIIRQTIRHQRKQLAIADQITAAAAIYYQFTESSFYHEAKVIACYLAYQGEVDTKLIIQQIWHDKKQCYLPRLHQNEQNHMDFYLYTHPHELSENRFGILEPKADPKKYQAAQNLDIVLLPLVAFDNEGVRLGMGSGYYDRSFEFLNQQFRPSRPYLIGLAYDFQKVEKIERNSWDVLLDAVITESGIQHFYGIN